MRLEDILLILFIFVIPATVASYAFIRISQIRKIYFPVLLVIGFAITFAEVFIIFLVNFGAIHSNGIAIQHVPDIIMQNPNPLIRFYGTLVFLCFLNTLVLTVLYIMIAKLLFANRTKQQGGHA
jgi:hypothetical protein